LTGHHELLLPLLHAAVAARLVVKPAQSQPSQPSQAA
jgi:hypothetical protein